MFPLGLVQPAIYLGVFLAVSAVGWYGKHALEERGAARVRGEVVAATDRAKGDAHEHFVRALQAIDAVERAKAADAAAIENEHREMRDARAKDAGGDAIVFGPEWAAWATGPGRVRNARPDRAGHRPGTAKVAADPASRSR